MFAFAFFIGIYSYLIFALGLAGLLYKQYIAFITVFYVIFVLTYFKKQENNKETKPQRIAFAAKFKRFVVSARNDKLITVMVLLLLGEVVVNLIGALGPELGFDALWYHLTLSKIYLLNHTISHIPGGLLYYSEMPRLAEMFYIAALAFGSETFAKIIHFSFGILSLIALYKLAREFFNKKIAFLAIIIFYSNLVVSWESITAYIDLARTFFEIMALWGFVLWAKTNKKQWLIESSVMLGLAISTKLLATGSLFIFITLILIYKYKEKRTFQWFLKNSLLYIFFTIVSCIPWFVTAYINTGNPVYPIFTNYETHRTILMIVNPSNFITSVWNTFTHAADPLSPIYIIFFPLFVFQCIKSKNLETVETMTGKRARMTYGKGNFRIIVLYSFLSLVIWYLIPQTGGGRYILPYLPVFSLVAASIFTYGYKQWFKVSLYGIVGIIACITIMYRGIANAKYLPVIFGKETKTQFLSNHLNFSFGDFYDIDGYLAKHINKHDKVLTYGLHNLYYIDFPFVDNSWIKPGEAFNYILVQDGEIPKRFNFWHVVYINSKTHIKLYSLKGQTWYY